ncbi:MAG: shikimate dehydrogenase [bacterium]|nr:shikimate dehydrogenase [bacterium]
MPRLALIGRPLSHSFSKQYFETKFSQLGLLNWQYDLWELDNIDALKSKIELHSDLLGFNVTIPYKIQVIPMCNSLSEAALSIGAVNCVKLIRNGNETLLHGENTDVQGFEISLMNWYLKNSKRALVFGNGGAAKAALYVLNKMGIFFIQVVRTITAPNQILFSELSEAVFANSDLIINCTPIGMYPQTENCLPINEAWIKSDHQYYDMVYNPLYTATMQLFANKGCSVKNGLEMLHLQAEKAWEIWNE